MIADDCIDQKRCQENRPLDTDTYSGFCFCIGKIKVMVLASGSFNLNQIRQQAGRKDSNQQYSDITYNPQIVIGDL